MRIVNLKQFLDLPAGTVFCAYALDGLDSLFGELRIKDFSSPDVDGYLYSSLDKLWASEAYDVLDHAKLFAVLEPSDVASLIVRLTKALNDSGCSQEELVRLLGEASIANTLDDEQVAE